MPRFRQIAAVLLLLAFDCVAQPPTAVLFNEIVARPPSAGMVEAVLVEAPAFRRGFIEPTNISQPLQGRQNTEPHPVRTHFVLERWLKALGGRDKLRAVHSMYVKAIVVSSGQLGTLESWQFADGRYKATVNLGDHEFTTVCDGHSGWTASDGAAEDLKDNALAAAITRSYLGSYSQFFPDRLPGSVEWVREDDDAYVLKLLPTGGLPITFYLDKTTGLPLRHEMVDGERTLTFYYLEWKDYGALKTWKRGRQSSGPDSPDLTVTAQDISWNPTLDPKLLQIPAQ